MRKIYTLFIALVVSVMSYGQLTFPFMEDFETFNAGQQLYNQVSNTTTWSTWSDAAGSAEDPFITEAEALSGANSVVINGTNDLVFFPGGGDGALEDGRYKVTLNIFVTDSTTGYYNFLQHFDAGNSQWGYQIQFDGGSASIDGNGTVIAAYTPNQWLNIVSFVDLDADWCEIYFDDVLVHSFQWSVGTSNTDIKKWDAINFYAWAPDGGTATAYFDDLKIEEVEAPEAPTNLTATIENEMDVVLAWDAPVNMTPLSYVLTRNGAVIADLTETTYTDMHVYPGAYTYAVRAVYDGLGTSFASEVASAVDGGVAREFVLFEQLNIYGAAQMNPSNRGLVEVTDTIDNIAVIALGYDQTYGNEYSFARVNNYYGDLYYAAIWADGIFSHSGSAITGSYKYQYVDIYDKMAAVPSVVSIDVDLVDNEGGSYTANVDLTEEFAYFDGGLKLRYALTQSNIDDDAGYDGKMNFICREMDTTGVDVVFVDGAQSVSFDFELSGDGMPEDYDLVVFVQHDDSKSVNQAVSVPMPMEVPSVNVTFNVDMSGADLADGEAVYVTGSFNGWIEPGNEGSTMLTDEDGDMVYTGIAAAPENAVFAYKYFKGAGWTNGEPITADRELEVMDVDYVIDPANVWGVVGINDVQLGLVEMYPNPFSNTLTINNLENVNQITISNVVGQTVMVVAVDEMTEVISTSELQSGIYFVTVIGANNNVRTERVVKQ